MSRLFSRRSFHKVKPGEAGYKSPTATQFRILRGKRAGEVVSNAERTRLTKGAHPRIISAEHKAGKRTYVSAATEAQAEKQIATRKSPEFIKRLKERAGKRREERNKNDFSLFDRRLNRWRGFRNETAVHVFLNKAGVTDRREFKGRNLAIAQVYRVDWYGPDEDTKTGAVFTGDGSALAKYDHIVVRDIDGNDVHFETDVEKLQTWWHGMSRRQRNAFEAELFYLRLREAA
jgi:hypothetical protein